MENTSQTKVKESVDDRLMAAYRIYRMRRFLAHVKKSHENTYQDNPLEGAVVHFSDDGREDYAEAKLYNFASLPDYHRLIHAIDRWNDSIGSNGARLADRAVAYIEPAGNKHMVLRVGFHAYHDAVFDELKQKAQNHQETKASGAASKSARTKEAKT